MGIFFAALGLPGLCGFIGEVFVTLGVWSFSKTLAVISASVVILTAAYILWTIQRVYLGAEYKGPHPEAITPMTRREVAIAAPLLAMAIVFGVYPRALFSYITPSINKTVDDLTNWTFQVKDNPASPLEAGPVSDFRPKPDANRSPESDSPQKNEMP
jgi:NADH-quinone oxidoreductase subunit M